MWYVKCAKCGNKIWDNSLVLLADVNEGVGRRPFCDEHCLEEYLNASWERICREKDMKEHGELFWEEDKRRKRQPNECTTDKQED